MKHEKKNVTQKDVVKVFGCWSLTKEELYLETMARRGWRLYAVTAPGIYRFEKADPADLVYAVEYVGKADDVAEEIAANCNAGWEFLCRGGKRRYYCAASKDLPHPSAANADEDICLRTTQGNLTTLLLLNLPGTFYCLMYLFIFLGEGGFLFAELFTADTAGALYFFGAALGIAAILYFLRNLSLIRKRLRRLGYRKEETV